MWYVFATSVIRLPEVRDSMQPVVIPLERRGFGQTMRRDAWWAQPLLTFTVLGGFVVYATWAAFQGEHYEFGPYLSPFYSPLLFGEGPHSWFGPKPAGGRRRCRFRPRS